MPRGDHATARQHRQWLRSLESQTGRKLTRLAKEVGIAPSTLTRPLKEGEHGTSTLHATTIQKIVTLTGVAPPTPAVPITAARPPLRSLAEDAIPYISEQPNDPIGMAIDALIAGRKGVDAWTIRSRSLELAGYMPGDVVLVDLNGVPEPGDVVCAQVHEWPRMKAETVMRIYERANGIGILTPRSMEPGGPVLVADGERVVIKGVVLSHRLRPPKVA